MRLAPKHLAFSSKTQGYLQQNAELFAAKCRVKTYVWPTRKAIFRTLLNHFFARFGVFTYVLGFYLGRFPYFLRSPTTNFRRNLSKKPKVKCSK